MTCAVLRKPTPGGALAAEAIWMPTTARRFTLSSAYQEVRQVSHKSIVYSHIWGPSLPLKVSFFMLRLLRRRLPLDEILCMMGFQLPSKCFYCSAAAEETTEHVFFTGRIALEVWGFFNAICGVTPKPQNLRACLLSWWLLGASSVGGRFVRARLPSWICRNIWKARNSAVFYGAKIRSQEVCQAIFKDIKAAFEI